MGPRTRGTGGSACIAMMDEGGDSQLDAILKGAMLCKKFKSVQLEWDTAVGTIGETVSAELASALSSIA